MSLNKEILLTGNLGRDPEAKYTDAGKFICEFSIAVQVGYGENKTTEWFKCVAWEKLGETLNEYLKKGSKLQVRGDFKQHFWTSKDGEARGEIQVTVKDFQFLPSKRDQTATPFDGDESPF